MTRENDMNYSALGESPVCDVCKKKVKVGEMVTQVFVGRVLEDQDNELVVLEEVYQLTHMNCREN